MRGIWCSPTALFEPTLISRQGAGIDTGLHQLGALALYRCSQVVIFRLQLRGGTFCRFERLRLRAGRTGGVFKLHSQLTGFTLRLVKRLTSYGQLRACLTKAVDFRCLTVQVAQTLLCVANITRQGFTRGLDRFKRSGRLVDRFQQYLKPQVITHCGFRYAAAPFRAM